MAVPLHSMREDTAPGEFARLLQTYGVLLTDLQALETFAPIRVCRHRPLLVVWVSREMARSRLSLR